jgi:hypothetical protein
MDPSQDEGNCQQDSEKTADTEKMNVTEEQMLLEHMEDKRMSHVWTVYSWRMRLNSCSPQAVKIFGQRKSVLYIKCTFTVQLCLINVILFLTSTISAEINRVNKTTVSNVFFTILSLSQIRKERFQKSTHVKRGYSDESVIIYR